MSTNGREIEQSARDFCGAEKPETLTPSSPDAVRSMAPDYAKTLSQMEEGYVSVDDGYNDPAEDPAVSEKQRRFMGAELRRKREGKSTRTGMSEQQLRDFARK